MKKIVFDIETRNFFEDVGSNDPADLDISVVCIYDYETDKYQAFEQHELKNLWPILETADMLIGYNSDHFDIPLLNKYYPGDLTKIKSLDIMKEIKKTFGRRLKLDSVAEATLSMNKSGHGGDAVKWWKNGEMDKIKKYCIDDVRITKELYDYARSKKLLKVKDAGKLIEIPLQSEKWEEKEKVGGITFTLPF